MVRGNNKMKHYHIVCDFGYDDCIKCRFLKDCFPKTYKKKIEGINKRWKEKYGDEF